MITFWQACLIATVAMSGGVLIGAHDKIFDIHPKERLEMLAEVNSRVCPTCPDCIKRCRGWGKWDTQIDTALGGCKIAPTPYANWNFAVAYPDGDSLGLVTFWECDLMLFHNDNGWTSPMSWKYDEGECVNVEVRECTQREIDD